MCRCSIGCAIASTNAFAKLFSPTSREHKYRSLTLPARPKTIMNGLCFIGTDTGVGKTFITAAVARLLRQQGHDVAVCKPVATGARLIGDRWVSEDTLLL